MKFIKIFLILLFLINFNFALAENVEENGYILYVVDGDTVGVNINGKEERVRLIVIDAPEIGECYADEAIQELKNLILNKNIKLISDNISDDQDKYGRLLRYIYLDDVEINAELIKSGHARAYLNFNFDKIEEYKNLAEQAELENLGLYNLENCKKNLLKLNINYNYLILILFFIFLFIILKIIKKFK